MTGIYANILETVGDTPVVRLNRMAPEGREVFVKVEAFNPMGSVKDRLALGIIEDAEERGALKPGQTVIEATSGNTGIGLAMVCAAKGYPLVVTMAENFSVERRKLLRFLGATVVLTPAAEKGSGMLRKAEELAEANGWFLCRQFENEANAAFHSRTTAPEILAAFEGTKLDYWVTGFGTGGTFKGVARVLHERSPDTQIVVCEPDVAQLLGSGIPQPAQGSHPNFRPHVMQGWSPDFIPKLTAEAVESAYMDRVLAIDGADAMRTSRELAQKEGIFAGTSGGATLFGALQVAREAPEGSRILAMLPDTGERYLSTPLFEDIGADMDEDEWALSKSTPSARFDVAAAPAAAPAIPQDLDPAAEAYVDEAIGSKEEPVVMFALTWCEFCWSVRKMMKAYGIPYRSVDLDSVPFQEDDLGGKIRAVLHKRTGSPTIPRIWVGGEHIGGATETFDAWKDGSLQKMLDALGVTYDRSAEADPYSFLPKWLQPR